MEGILGEKTRAKKLLGASSVVDVANAHWKWHVLSDAENEFDVDGFATGPVQRHTAMSIGS